MAPLYDTGAGSTYDLRHFTMGGPPKLARWDYHSTHINLLYVLSTIVPEKSNRSMLQALADRWQSYMVSNPRPGFCSRLGITCLCSFFSRWEITPITIETFVATKS